MGRGESNEASATLDANDTIIRNFVKVFKPDLLPTRCSQSALETRVDGSGGGLISQ